MVSVALDRIDAFAANLARFVIAWRWLVIFGCLAVSALVASNASTLTIANNYRVFFSENNPELNTFEEFQATYTKNDNFLFVLRPKSGNVFDADTLAAVEALTEAGWQIPHAIRVDSVTNFQSTTADGDELIVEDLVQGAYDLSAETLAEKRRLALAEPLIKDQLLTEAGDVTAVNVVLQYHEK